jgi:hypothetical protein
MTARTPRSVNVAALAKGRFSAVLALAAVAVACTPSSPDAGKTPARASNAAGSEAAAALVPADRDAKVALGRMYQSGADLYAALKMKAGGGAPLSLDDMPDWTGFWQRVGPPLFDPEQKRGELTTAKLKPDALADLQHRHELSAQGIEYDPLSNCSPPGFPRWLAIPFLREFIVTPSQTYLFSETMNNLRRVYTDGRAHPPAADAYPTPYGDSIGFWTGHTLVIHTNQVAAGIFHRNDPKYSEQLDAVEVWNKVDPDTVVVDVWAYDPETLLEPWYVRQTYKHVSNADGSLRIGYWYCGENPNNTVIQTDQGTSQFSDFTFTKPGEEENKQR